MHLPRLMIADEFSGSNFPVGAFVAAMLKQKGYSLRLFIAGVNEPLVAALQALLGVPATLLDPVALGEPHNVRRLFQVAADEGAINLILAPLGKKERGDEGPFRLDAKTVELAKILDCPVVACFDGNSSAMFTAKTVMNAAHAWSTQEGFRVDGMLFSGVPNLREYQLLDLEISRRSNSLRLGFVPRSILRPLPSVSELCTETTRTKALLSMRSASVQLGNMEYQIQWPVLRAISLSASPWKEQPSLWEVQPGERPLKIGVVRDLALCLSGNNTELLLRECGCTLVDIVPGQSVPQAFDGLYLPHGVGSVIFGKVVSDPQIVRFCALASGGDFFTLAEGGSAPFLGKETRFTNGEARKSLALLPYSAYLKQPSFETVENVFATRNSGFEFENPLLCAEADSVRGYISRTQILRGEGMQGCWILQDESGKILVGNDAWANGLALATSGRFEYWGSPELFRNWILNAKQSRH